MSNTLLAEAAFNKKLIKLGIGTVIFAIIANFIPAIYVYVAYGITPGIDGILRVWGIAAASYGISWVVQPIAYFGVLGASGSYIGWLAGAVGDIRLPAVTMAQKVAKVEQGTHEGDVMATIGTSSSVLVSVGFVTLFTFIGSRVLPLLPQSVLDAFNYILPVSYTHLIIWLIIWLRKILIFSSSERREPENPSLPSEFTRTVSGKTDRLLRLTVLPFRRIFWNPSCSAI